jgi:hypothetical protein
MQAENQLDKSGIVTNKTGCMRKSVASGKEGSIVKVSFLQNNKQAWWILQLPSLFFIDMGEWL